MVCIVGTFLSQKEYHIIMYVSVVQFWHRGERRHCDSVCGKPRPDAGNHRGSSLGAAGHAAVSQLQQPHAHHVHDGQRCHSNWLHWPIWQLYVLYAILMLWSHPGVAKSIVRVVRVVHFLIWTNNFFQLTCPWTSEKFRCLGDYGLKNNFYFQKNAV